MNINYRSCSKQLELEEARTHQDPLNYLGRRNKSVKNGPGICHRLFQDIVHVEKRDD